MEASPLELVLICLKTYQIHQGDVGNFIFYLSFLIISMLLVWLQLVSVLLEVVLQQRQETKPT